jgi:hypothetical protein
MARLRAPDANRACRGTGQAPYLPQIQLPNYGAGACTDRLSKDVPYDETNPRDAPVSVGL